MIIIVILTRIFGAFIESQLPSGVFLMEVVREELTTYGIPVLLLVVILPLIAGLNTGITLGYVGASFPVMLSLAGPETGGLIPAIILSFGFGAMGMMLSPIHVCFIVTTEYFRTSLFETIKGIIKPILFVLAFSAAYAFVVSLIAF